ncbi:RING finger and transmembrane domain-containing protein 2-like isoform X2 [Acanthaster planci]|uniref:RING finger and transmembrane domain-containing protein 2-like isoform X2 n=1 Tax=Acanthaster planci TaxID=133434 RepID=A0A8B7YTP4_ACAPL|nr:RING finger and transmembrane domain-containing protein 2-like isoform X2 [Acanthaster planci]
MSGNGRVVLNLNPLLEVYSVTVLFIGMQAAFSIFNCIVKKQVSCWDERNLRSVIATFLLLCLIVYSVHRFFFGHLILQSLSFTTYSFDELSLWTVFVVVYAIGITDYVISYVAMATKCVVIALPRACLSFERRGRFFQFIESLYQLYQFLIPLPLWISFVSDSTGLYWFIGGVLGSLYVIWKLFETYHKLCKCKAFFKSILQHSRLEGSLGVHCSIPKTRGTYKLQYTS